MKKILIILLFCGFWANAQQYHDKGAKFEFATNEGDTITVNTRIPIIDEFGLINYYVDVADLLALNPAPVLEWGNITGTLSNQTDLQGALNDKADQSALTAHTSNGNIHFTQSAISITESQVSDLKDYLRGDINDTNGANKLTLGSLEVTGQTILQNGLNMSSVPVGTSDNILTLNQTTGDVEQRVFSLGDIDIANAAGVNQFPVGLGDQLRIQGSGDTSISFDGVTNTININSTPGSGGGGAVTSFNGRDGAVVSQAGDYSTAMVNENTNLYFTEARVRGTDLTGLTVTNTPISSTNTFIQALGRLQGQINNRITGSYTGFDSRYVSLSGDVMTGNLSVSQNLDIVGPSTGSQNSAYMRFLESNGSTRNGIIGFTTSSTSDLDLVNDLAGARIRIQATGTSNQLRFIDSGGNWAVWHSGNLTLSTLGGEPAFTKNTAFNKNFGTTSGTVAQGNDSRINNGQTAFGWGNHASEGYITGSYTGFDSRYVSKSGDVMTGNLTAPVGIFNGSNQPLRLNGAGSGDSNNVFLAFYESDGTTRQAYVGFGTTANSDFTIQNTVTGKNLVLSDDGILNYNGGITAAGNITATGDVIANSDRRLKKNIKRIDNALAIVQLLGGYEYDRKDIDLHQAGVLSQEVEEVFPTAVSEDEKGIKSVAYNQLIALLIEAVKEQQREIENLKNMINEK